MTGFQLDTSGSVRRPGFARPLVWSDLSAFEQGYVEALLTDYSNRLSAGLGERLHVGFSDLAPETLALILKDCEAYQASEIAELCSEAEGRWLWHARNLRDDLKAFPPLTPTLGDDGKVYLRQAQEAQS